jgi:hypothetical protein
MRTVVCHSCCLDFFPEISGYLYYYIIAPFWLSMTDMAELLFKPSFPVFICGSPDGAGTLNPKLIVYHIHINSWQNQSSPE